MADGDKLVMETGRDTVAYFESDPRCVAATGVTQMVNGDIYFGTTPDELAYNT